MNSLKEIALIDKFENGSLSEAERLEFVLRLENEPDFKNLYDDYQSSADLLKIHELCEVQQELDKFGYDDNDFPFKKVGVIIGSVSAIFLAGSLLVHNTNTPEKKIVETSLPQKHLAIVNDSPVFVSEETETKKISIVTVTPGAKPEEKVYKKSTLSVEDTIVPVRKEEKTIASHHFVETPKIPIVPISVFDCDVNAIVADYQVNPACVGEPNGSIIIKKVEGPVVPYSISLNEKKSFLNSGQFTDLSAGNYSLIISDTKNCVKKYSIQINAVACVGLFDQQPDKPFDEVIYLPGQTWKIPMPDERRLVEIKNKQGDLVYQKEVSMNEQQEWNGQHMNGSTLPSGVYYYSVKNLTNLTERVGTISIIQY